MICSLVQGSPTPVRNWAAQAMGKHVWMKLQSCEQQTSRCVKLRLREVGPYARARSSIHMNSFVHEQSLLKQVELHMWAQVFFTHASEASRMNANACPSCKWSFMHKHFPSHTLNSIHVRGGACPPLTPMEMCVRKPATHTATPGQAGKTGDHCIRTSGLLQSKTQQWKFELGIFKSALPTNL